MLSSSEKERRMDVARSMRRDGTVAEYAIAIGVNVTAARRFLDNSDDGREILRDMRKNHELGLSLANRDSKNNQDKESKARAKRLAKALGCSADHASKALSRWRIVPSDTEMTLSKNPERT